MEVKIIITVSEVYKDVADIFFNLFKKNWLDCPYEYIVSYGSSKIFKDFGGIPFISDEKNTLPGNIKKIVEKYPADYYICLLGDSFFEKKIDTSKIMKLITIMQEENYDFCNIYPKKKKANLYSKVKKNEIYGINFISFIASKAFIYQEFSNKISDFDFEEKYLKISQKKDSKNLYWDKIIVNDNNIFNIVHGIQKGVWIKKSYKILKKYSIVKNSKRKKMSCIESFIHTIRLKSQIALSPTIRKILKRILSNLGFKFSSKY